VNREWYIKTQDGRDVREIVQGCGVSETAARLLINRGHTELDEVEKFLHGSIRDVRSAFDFVDMGKAVERIKAAIDNGEKILIYGDYDVDGITAVSILLNYLRASGAVVDYYIPARLTEGYGLNTMAIDRFVDDGVYLMITVDCGVTALEQIAYAQDKGIDVIVTDHHEPQDELPACVAVINPKVENSGYGFKELSGVGVAFKLVCALEGEKGLAKLFFQYSELVAIGTVADMMSLSDENRVMVRFGLDMLNCDPKNKGIKALLRMLEMDKQITSSTVGYYIAPRINAVGKLGDASRAVELFSAETDEAADLLAQVLFDENKVRQEMEAEMLAEAVSILEGMDIGDDRVLVLHKEGWHGGLIGSVASRLCDMTQKICILIAVDEKGIGKGSSRSRGGFDIFSALGHVSEMLENYGGHEYAAGFTIQGEHIEGFKKAINAYAATVDNKPEALEIDCELDERLLPIDQVKALHDLEPFGADNATPLFCVSGVRIMDLTQLGDRHTRLNFMKNGRSQNAILFGTPPEGLGFKVGDLMDLALGIEINVYKGMESVQALVRDYRKAEAGEAVPDSEDVYLSLSSHDDAEIPGEFRLSKEQLGYVYRCAVKKGAGARYSVGFSDLIAELNQAYKCSVKYVSLRLALDVLAEVGILAYTAVGDIAQVVVGDYGKVELNDSTLWQRLSANNNE